MVAYSEGQASRSFSKKSPEVKNIEVGRCFNGRNSVRMGMVRASLGSNTQVA